MKNISFHRSSLFLLFWIWLLALLVSCGLADPDKGNASPLTPQVAQALLGTPFAEPAILPQITLPAAEPKVNLSVGSQAGFSLKFSTPADESQPTQQAESMLALVQELRSRGILQRETGEYFSLPDFDASWAQINYYDWLPTGYEPRDFVVKAEAQWESASLSANWWNSGCGFVFRMNARGDHYLFYLGLDGWVYLFRKLDNSLTNLGSWYYGEVEKPKGGAKLALVAEQDWITVFVNGKLVDRTQDQTFSSGMLGYALASGTNKDYGTRCRMKNVELWELK